jgi:small subunit ribosomal protein S6
LKTVAAKLYEGMFLVDSALAASDWQGVINKIRSILDKAGAEIVSVDKWDERKLAYGIKGKSRGTYILTYFRADGSQVGPIERAAQLSEDIMRVLILCVEDVEERYLTKTTQGGRTEEPEPARLAEDGESKRAEQDTSHESFDVEQAQANDGDGPRFIGEASEQDEAEEQDEP